MGGPYKRKKYHYGDTHLKKGWRTKRRTRDLDQIDTDLGEGKVEKLLAQEVDFDKAGLGQFYCVHCAKDFINPKAFQDHVKGKPHKRRLHALKTDPYTIEEANRAAGEIHSLLPRILGITSSFFRDGEFHLTGEEENGDPDSGGD